MKADIYNIVSHFGKHCLNDNKNECECTRKSGLIYKMTCRKCLSLQEIRLLSAAKPVLMGQLTLSCFAGRDKAVLEFPLPAPVCAPRLFVALKAGSIHLRGQQRSTIITQP